MPRFWAVVSLGVTATSCVQTSAGNGSHPDGEQARIPANAGGRTSPAAASISLTRSSSSNERPARDEPTHKADDRTRAGTKVTGVDCIADRVPAPSGRNCECAWSDCRATTLRCTCDVGCHQSTSSCLIETDSDGYGSSGDDILAECDEIRCEPETDSSDDLECEATECRPPPSSLSIEPKAIEAKPSRSWVDFERVPSDAGVLLVVDNSGATAGAAMTTACGIDGFIDPAGSQALSHTVDAHGEARARQDSTSTEPLRQLIVSQESPSVFGTGLERAFEAFAELEVHGMFDATKRHEVVVVTRAGAPEKNSICSMPTRKHPMIELPNFNPPAPTANCAVDHVNFYKSYFTSRGIKVHALHFSDAASGEGPDDLPLGHSEIVEATNGQIVPIAECQALREFLANVGGKSAGRDSLCLPPDIKPDPATIVVTYGGETQAHAQVPENPAEGWAFDAGRNCLVLSGSWEDRYGSYRVEYIDRNASPVLGADPVACLDRSLDILKNTLQVKCDEAEVPRSRTDGWSFDSSSYCLTLHGAWATAGCDFRVEYF